VNLTARDLAKLILLVFVLLSVWRFFVDIAHWTMVAALVVLLAMIFSPVVSWAERHHVPRWFSAVGLALVLLGLAAIFFLLVVPPLIQQAAVLVRNIPEYWSRAAAWLGRMLERYPAVRDFVSEKTLAAGLSERLQAVLSHALALTRTVIEDIGGTVVVFVMMIFVLSSPRGLLIGLFSMVPAAHRAPLAHALRATAKQVRVWAWASALIGLIEAITVWIGLTLLHVQAPLLLATLVFFGEFLPYIGPILAAVPAVLFALATGPYAALWTVLLYLGIHIVESSLLVPFITSRQMEFHPLSVVFAIVTLGEIYGIIGAVLAVPALAAARAFYYQFVLQPQRISPDQMREYADAVIESHPPGSRATSSAGGIPLIRGR
jgi:predicted PurR-regulated permease PerM